MIIFAQQKTTDDMEDEMCDAVENLSALLPVETADGNPAFLVIFCLLNSER